jgi:hypothetical protein
VIEIRSATIIGPYRYDLIRQWDDSLPILEWVMLNPSTADEDLDDPTIRRCRGFADRWGFGGLVVHNLFAWRATNPRELAVREDPIGPRNLGYLAAAQPGDTTIVAWGAHPMAKAWWKTRQPGCNPLRYRVTYCLGTTLSGAPKHPLYVKSDTPLRPWLDNVWMAS